LDELDENKVKQKFQNLKILKERAARQKTHFKNHLIKKLCSMGSKCLPLDANNMCGKQFCQKTCLVIH
jgi:hypothetical protein